MAAVVSAQQEEGRDDERTRALRAAQQRLSAIIETEPECVKLLDAEGRLLEMNGAGLRMIEAASLAEVAGQCVYGLVAEEHREAFRALTERVCAGSRGTLEFEMVGLRGARRWMETHAVPFVDEESGTKRLLAITRDITESKLARQALAESERRARSLVGRLIDAQESERRRLADELHDLIGQNLTALGIDLAALRARVPDGGDAARLEAMRALVEGTIGSIRGVMTGLRPPALEEFGLVPALRAYAAEFAQRTGMAVEVQAAAEKARLAEGAELALFRIAQEALTNAAKHSGGTSVRIRFATGGGRVRLSIEDDGAGFDQPDGARAARRGGWGLPEMRERAEAHAGSLLVDTAAGGTRVTVEIPIKVS